MARKISFDENAWGEYVNWLDDDIKIGLKINKLIKDILRDPFKGLGKPEPLRHDLKGYWSRRITEEHRIVYKVTDSAIIVIACKNHYSGAASRMDE